MEPKINIYKYSYWIYLF